MAETVKKRPAAKTPRKKTVAGAQSAAEFKDTDWKTESVRFTYSGKKYRVRIDRHLVLNDMSLGEIKDRLNELPGRFAYWKSLQVTAERELEKLTEDYDIWYADVYGQAAETFDKAPTETKIKYKAMLMFTDGYRQHQTQIRNLKYAVAQMGVITASFNHQVWTLRSIASLTSQEMNNIEVYGRGTLSSKDQS